MNIELQPWAAPNFVIMVTPPRPRQEGIHHVSTFPLQAVDADALAKMCDDFRAEVFRKAGKTDPALQHESEKL